MTATGTAAPIFIGGTWRAGRGAPVTSFNPVDGSVNGTFAGADAADIAEAVERGRAAMNAPAWRNLLPHERARIIRRIGDGIAAETEPLALLQLRDNGKPLYETRGLVISAANTFGFFASALETLESEVTPSRGAFLTMTTYQPLGVVGAITPWNSPIASEAQKVAPALAAGCAVVLKPSELTPLLALELGRIAQAAGLPDGLLSVVPGTGAVAGAALVAHPDVRKISFTGGTETGRAIARVAAEKLMPVTLELGGKSPTIVFADADLDIAINGVLFGIFSSQGQSCIAGSRLFVERAIYPAFMERLVARAKALRVGDPLDPRTHLGPLISEPQRAKVEAYVELARAEGGRVVCGGRRPDGDEFARGTFYEPTIIEGLTQPVARVSGRDLRPGSRRPCRSTAKPASSSRRTTRCTAWPAESGPPITDAPGASARRSRRAPYGSTPTSSSASRRRLPERKPAVSGVEKGRTGIRSYQQEQSVYWGLDERPNPWAGVP